MNVNQSTGGIDVAKRSEVTARDLVLETMREFPDATREAQFEHFRKLLSETPDYQRSVDWYFFANISTYVAGTRHSDPAKREAVRAAQVTLTKSIKSQIELLSLPMPNGKPMRECSGQEMASFGAGYKRIADKVGKAKTVGSVLNEAEVRTLLSQ